MVTRSMIVGLVVGTTYSYATALVSPSSLLKNFKSRENETDASTADAIVFGKALSGKPSRLKSDIETNTMLFAITFS